MNLTELLEALGKIEDKGAEYKSYLKKLIADKDAAIAVAESLSNSTDVRLSSFATSLGCKVEDLDSTIKELKKSKKDLETQNTVLETLKSKMSEAEIKYKSLERQGNLKEFSSRVGADFEVLKDLLPADIEVVEDKVKVEGKELVFAEYVDATPALAKYRNSIFTVGSNPPKTPPKLPTGKSTDKAQDPLKLLSQTELERQKTKAERLLNRFSGKP
jgi:vacuolar-type H+-ATPase subunit I/STV1